MANRSQDNPRASYTLAKGQKIKDSKDSSNIKKNVEIYKKRSLKNGERGRKKSSVMNEHERLTRPKSEKSLNW